MYIFLWPYCMFSCPIHIVNMQVYYIRQQQSFHRAQAKTCWLMETCQPREEVSSCSGATREELVDHIKKSLQESHFVHLFI